MNGMNQELYHHGILGMRWGIRRTPKQLGYPPAEPRKTADGKVGTYKTKGHVTDADYGITKSKLAKGDSSDEKELKWLIKQDKKLNRYNNDVKKYLTATQNELKKSRESRYVRAFNNTAAIMNTEASKRPIYRDEAEEMHDRIFGEQYKKLLIDDAKSTKSYQRAKKLINKYGHEYLDDDNAKIIKRIEG